MKISCSLNNLPKHLLAMGCLLLLASALPAQEKGINRSPTGEPLIKLIRGGQPIDMILDEISKQAGIPIEARGPEATKLKITILARDEPLMSVLGGIASQNGLILYSPEGEARVILYDAETYKNEVVAGQVQRRTFVLNEITIADLEPYLKTGEDGVLSEFGTHAYNETNKTLVVEDLAANLTEVEWLLDWLDIKLDKRVFQIYKGNIEFILEKLQEVAEGLNVKFNVDLQNQRIIVEAERSVIAKMEVWVDLLDIRPIQKSYPIKNVGMEGDGFREIEDAVVEIMSPDAFIFFDPHNHQLIVRDVPQRHEDLEKMLGMLDKPPLQVLVQAEIIETNVNRGFNYGTEIEWSEDYFSAVRDGVLSGGTPSVGSLFEQNPAELGFINREDEFPGISVGSGGIQIDDLTKNARIAFTAAMSDTRTQVLQQPRVYIKNHSEATIDIGGDVPFLTTRFTSSVNTAETRTFTQETREEGIAMDVSVAVGSGDFVEMEIDIRNNEATIEERVFEGQTSQLVGLRKQEVQTQLIVPNGNTRVLGGLYSRSKQVTKSGVPFLKDIPVVGGLIFGSTNYPAENNLNRMLMIFVTPYIVRIQESPLAPEPEKTFKDRGYEVTNERDVVEQKSLREELLEQAERMRQLQDREPPIKPNDPTIVRELDPEDARARLQGLKQVKFVMPWTHADETLKMLESQLTRRGRIVGFNQTEQSVTVLDEPENIPNLADLLTEINRQTAQGLDLGLPEEIEVKPIELFDFTEEVPDSALPTDDNKWDPFKKFTTYKAPKTRLSGKAAGAGSTASNVTRSGGGSSGQSKIVGGGTSGGGSRIERPSAPGGDRGSGGSSGSTPGAGVSRPRGGTTGGVIPPAIPRNETRF